MNPKEPKLFKYQHLVLTVFFLLSSSISKGQQANPNLLNEKLMYGKQLCSKGQFLDAEVIFREIADSAKQQGLVALELRALIGLANSEISNRKPDQALKSIHRAELVRNQLSSVSDSANYVLGTVKGKILIEKGEFEESLSLFQSLLMYSKGEDSVRTFLQGYIGRVFWSQNKFDSAQKYFKKNLTIFLLGDNELESAGAYDNLGLLFGKKGMFDSAEYYFLKAKKIYEAGKVPDVTLSISYNYLGVVYMLTKRNIEARRYLESSLKLKLRSMDEYHPSLADVYNNLGIVFHNLEEFSRAREYHLKALEIRRKNFGDNWHTAKSLNNIGITYMNQGDYDLAIDYLKKALEIKQRTYGDLNLETIKSEMNIGICMLYMQKLDSAKYFFSLGEKKLEHFPDEQTVRFNHKMNWTKYFIQKKDYPNGILYARKLINKSLELHGNGRTLLESYMLAGEISEVSGRFDEALLYYDSAMRIKKIPNQNILLPDYAILSSAQMRKGTCYNKMYRESGDLNHLRASLTHFIEGEKSMSEFYHFLNLDDKLHLSKMGLQNLNEAINTCYELLVISNEPQIKESFFYLINKKNSKLVNELNKKRTYYEHSIDSISFREGRLIEEISSLYASLQDPAMGESGRRKLFEKQRELEFFLEKLQNDNPAYFQSKYPKYISRENLQSQLNENEIVLQFTLIDSSLYVTTSEKGTLGIRKIEINTSFYNSLNQLASILQSPDFENFRNELLSFQLASNNLFISLLGQVDSLLTGKELIIIPDEDLYLLPFEILVKTLREEVTDYSDMDFLLSHNTIFYCTSLESFIRSRTNPRNQGGKSMIYGVSFLQSEKELPVIPNAIEEARGVSEILNVKNLFLDGEAMESLFWSNAKYTNSLHIATHADIDIEDPFLSKIILERDSLNDGYIYGFEFLGKEVPFSLVFLSTCYSGNTRILPGEGMVSIASGFLLSGTRNVITSIWAVNDASSVRLVKGFYEYLNGGNSISRSLCQTKRDYLKYESGLLTHPHFWANYVLNGDNRYRGQPNFSLFILGFILITMVIVAAFTLKSKKRI